MLLFGYQDSYPEAERRAENGLTGRQAPAPDGGKLRLHDWSKAVCKRSGAPGARDHMTRL